MHAVHQSPRRGESSQLKRATLRPPQSAFTLSGRRELALGAHVVVPRRGYLHHGIYVGAGKVVHYAGLAHGLRRGCVEETSLQSFAGGRTVRVDVGAPAHFDPAQIIDRARSRLGEDGYRLLTNNCEHFCEWCLRGTHRSYQVEALLRLPGYALRTLVRFALRLRPRASLRSVQSSGT